MSSIQKVYEVVREFPSETNPKTRYQIRRGADGEVYCTCHAWRFSREKPKVCKHMVHWAEEVARGAAHLLPEGSR